MPTNAVSLRDDGKAVVSTPPDPHTGAHEVVLDPIDLVHALLTQIPDAGKHLVRYDGAYSHQSRGRVREVEVAEAARVTTNSGAEADGAGANGVGASGDGQASLVEPVTPAEPGSPEARWRSTCFRPDEGRQVLKKVFEVDPLLCHRFARSR